MAVSRPELGRKYTCFKCSALFYDLNRPEPLCPKCGADQREDPNPDPREAILQRYKGRGDGGKGKDLKKGKGRGRRPFDDWSEVDDEEIEGEEFEDDDVDEDDEDMDDFAMDEEEEL